MKQKLLSFVLLCVLLVGFANAQTRVVSGKVTSADNGAPLSGVSITVVGSTIATSTDDAGNYAITVPSNYNAIMFIYLGYQTQEHSVATYSQRGNTLNVELVSITTSLDEVVVTGGGLTTTQRQLGNASTTIKTQDVTQGKASNVAAGLSGKVPGLQVNAVSGGLNPNYRLILRGQRSITGNNQALLVVDNIIVPTSMLGNLNPEDIDDIQVLNGAGAAALYGSDASNGALIITTKKGKAGQTFIKLSNTSTFEEVSYYPKLQSRFGSGTTPDNVKTYTPYENQQYGPEFDGSMVPIGKPLEDGSIQTIPYSPTNGKNDFWEAGYANQTDLSLTSGDDKSSYYIAGQYFDQKSTVPRDKYRRVSLRANGTRKIYDNFDVEFNTNYIYNWYDMTTQTGSMYTNIMMTPAHIQLTDYRNWETDPFANPNGYYNEYYDNPYFTLDNWRQFTVNEYFQGNLQLRWNPIKPLTFTYRIGLSSRNNRNKSQVGKFTYSEYTKSISGSSKTDEAGSVSDYQNWSFQLVSDFLAGYKTSITEDLMFEGTLGASIRDNNAKNLNVSASGLVVDGLYDIGNSSNIPSADEINRRSRQVGVYGDLRFGFKNYLFLHVTARNDWRSILAKENRSFFYPSADLSFIVTDAIPSLKDLPWLEYLKLRGGYAYVGQVNLGAYELSSVLSQQFGFPYTGGPGFSIGSIMVASNINPEITKGPEAGFDFDLFNGDVSGGFTWYKTNTVDQTLEVNVSQATGYNILRTNVGEVQNQGIETFLRVTPIRNRNGWTVTVGGNYALNRNKVLSLADDAPEYVFFSSAGGQVAAVVGEPFPLIRTTRYNRDSQGRIIVDPNSGFPSHDGTYQMFGTSNPPHILGADLEVRWKGFRLTSLFEYRTGHYIYNGITTAFDFSGAGIRSTWFNRERFVIPNSSYLDPSTGEYVANTNITTRSGGADFWTDGTRNTGVGENYAHSAAFWKWREASLSYDIPAHIFKGYVKGATVSLQGRNLFIWVPKTNLYTDPEYSQQGADSNAIGVANVSLTPPARYFGGTVSFSF
ncbi:SusC/RagA family TonB-linked outer membrane protein [Parapedobacter tibetensis]|uniref:SusC/RagA family TonB-linked outer membrane protein n=1 Tax=Parapedobacter tibetensis TaxID=2972951 RepID=UPI00214DD834|nr:SusC/RagA family TonB-linked outer membrane protein [Parapedobacter tibetensis]